MAYTVFFKEGKETLTASNFIGRQPIAHRELLQAMADALSLDGRIAHPLATKKANGDWSVLLKDDNGDVYIYTLFVSRLEREEARSEVDKEGPSGKRDLVIIDPAGPKDSVGGYHPGYWSIARYATFLEEAQRALFLKAMDQIEHHIPADSYSMNDDGSISIHIHKQERAYTVSVTCRAAWR